MILPKPSDFLVTGYSPAARLRIVFVDTTDSARALEQSHLCGPSAGLALAEALAGVSLLGADLNGSDETVMLRAMVSGPLKGWLTEAAADGGLRGYTMTKVVNELDVMDEIDLDAVLGDNGRINIIQTAPGRIISQALFDISPVSSRAALEEYYRCSQQRHVMVQVAALSYDGYIVISRGVMVEVMPDSDKEVFAEMCRLDEDGTALESLETCLTPQEWCRTMGLDDVRFDEPKPLLFKCRCSMERVESVIAALSVEELQEMACKGEESQIFCHMCGKGYQITPTQIEELIALRGDTKGSK